MRPATTFSPFFSTGTWVSSRLNRAPHQWSWTYGRLSTSTAVISISSLPWWPRSASRRPWYSWCRTASADTLRLEQSGRLSEWWGGGKRRASARPATDEKQIKEQGLPNYMRPLPKWIGEKRKKALKEPARAFRCTVTDSNGPSLRTKICLFWK